MTVHGTLKTMRSLFTLLANDRARVFLLTLLSAACSTEAASNDGPPADGSSENTGGTSSDSKDNDGGAQSSGGDGSGGLPSSGGASATTKNTYVYLGSGAPGDDEDGNVTIFRLSPDGTALSYVNTRAAGGNAISLVVDPDSQRLFAADAKNGGVLSFSIAPRTGALSANGNVASERKPTYLTLANEGSYLFAANRDQGSVDVYPIAADGRAQSFVQNEPTGRSPAAIAVDRARVLVANTEANSISFFDFSSERLVVSEPSTLQHTSPRHIALGPEGRAYVSSEVANHVTAYTFESDGSASMYWQSERLPQGDVGPGGEVRVTPDGRFVYALNDSPSDTIAVFSSTDGLIVERYPTRGTGPTTLAIDPHGKVLLVANLTTKELVGFTIEADGALEHTFTQALEVSPRSIAIAEIVGK